MIHSKATTLCITKPKPNQDVVMTTRLPQITELLKSYGVIYNRKSIGDINEIIQGIPGDEYLDYELFNTSDAINMSLHYHDDLEARFITGGVGIFGIICDDTVIELQVTVGDYIVLPSKIIHRFHTTGPLSAIRFFTNYNGYIAHYIDDGIIE